MPYKEFKERLARTEKKDTIISLLLTQAIK